MNEYRNLSEEELTFCETCHADLTECECMERDYEVLYCSCGNTVYLRRYLEPRCIKCGRLFAKATGEGTP